MKKLIALSVLIACSALACKSAKAENWPTLPTTQEERDAIVANGMRRCMKFKQNPQTVSKPGTDEEAWADLCRWYNKVASSDPRSDQQTTTIKVSFRK